jgi:uncharacterized protein YndB with AHSA1/START domain
MSPAIIHKSFVIEHTYHVAMERLWSALQDPVKKRRWFAEGEGFVVDDYSLDFRVGGFERTRFRFGEGPSMTTDCVYLDIADHERLVFAYSMTIGGAPMSSSLASIELTPGSAGITLKFTEHTAFVDGNDGSAARREGSLGLLDALAQELEKYA